MVNFSSKTPEQKPLLYFPCHATKTIRKTPKISPKPKISKLYPSLENHQLSLNTSFSSISHSSLSQWLSPVSNNLLNILQPFSNCGLFPSSLQNLVSGSAKLNQSDILHIIYQLKTPDNPINFQKKIEKMKLLALGQETILQNYLKDKYLSCQKPELLKEYYKYMKSKLALMKDLQEIKTKGPIYELINEHFSDEFINYEDQSWLMKFNIHSKLKNGMNAHSLLYDNYLENKQDYLSYKLFFYLFHMFYSF